MAEVIRVLVVDDSAMMRRMVKEILDTDPQIEVVGTAKDGEDAVLKDRQWRPDVITMDINMPVMDGLTALLHIFEQHPGVAVVMLSSLTKEGALATFEALELGAFDYVGKPSGTVSSNLYIIGKELISKIKAADAYARKKQRRSQRNKEERTPVRPASKPRSVVSKPPVDRTDAARVAVVIGVSTGGPGTLMDILPKLPADLKAALIVVQHMPASFTGQFARRLGEYCSIPFREARAGERLLAGQGILAPGGSHLVVRQNSLRQETLVRLTAQPEDALFIPSVNVTMNSVLEVFGKNTIGVLLTGMGDDGADAMVNVRRAGGITIAEDESTAVVFGMPREAIERGGAAIVAPAHRVADEIMRAVAKRL